jgi:predicted ATPase/DNA-binding winged helix-turn-helix (wHTH) protein
MRAHRFACIRSTDRCSVFTYAVFRIAMCGSLKAPRHGVPRDIAMVREIRRTVFGVRFQTSEARLRGGQKVKLTERAFDILWALVDANGECVTKDTLLARIWGDEVVEENNLQAHISANRRALGADRDMIVTEFGRGYWARRPAQAAAATLQPPAGSVLPPPLPAARTPMIGRDRELESLVGLLEHNRLVTIVGPGGVGKTRLALEAACARSEHFNGHVHFVEMAAVATPEAAWPALADALGIEATGGEATGGEPTQEAIVGLQGQRILVVIDNCEHLAGQVSRIVERLSRIGPHLYFLATSQQVLNVDGECVFRLAPLAIPPADVAATTTTLEYPAVQLFVDRVAAHLHEFACDDSHACAIASICRQLDGIPLAIELAAARVPTLGVHGVLAGLADRFRLLTGGRRNWPRRHQTLRATVAWSDSLLSDDERRFFRGLSSFLSVFTIDAAHAVVGRGDDRWQTADLLDSLVQKSLLQTDLSGRVVRYRLLETLREYAQEQLASSEDVDDVRRRHAVYFLERSQQALAEWKRMPTHEWRDTYRHDSKDIRSVLSSTLTEKKSREVGIRLLATAIPFWVEFSMLDDCRHWVSLALSESADLDAWHEMSLRAALGISLTWARGPIAENRIAWTRALELAHTLGDTEIELQAHYGLWLYGLRTGNHGDALRHANAMLDAASAANDDEAAMVAARIVGVSLHVGGDQAAARERVEASVSWHERHPLHAAFRFGLGQHAAALAFLARILWMQGHTEQAISTAERAVEQATALDHACTLCCVLAEGLCLVAVFNRDSAMVEASARTLIETAARHGLQFWKTYGELYEFWAIAQTEPEKLTADRTAALLATLERTCFEFHYTPMLIDLIGNERLPRQSRELLNAAAAAAGKAG